MSAKMVGYTPYHSQFLAHRLTLSGTESFARSLSAAKVEMKPHQVDAALFALQSPLSKGAILADEVGLGKTIEAGLVIAQRWAERRRRILLIVPASLRKQWAQELSTKFSIPSVILDAKVVKDQKRVDKAAKPFDRNDAVIIVSYEYADKQIDTVGTIAWNLVVFDEAHRLRNVHRKTGSARAKNLKRALGGENGPFRVLLTATPLQNSLMELYGLVSIVDVRTGRREVIEVNTIGAREPRLENYIVRRLVDRDEIDYDANSELLFKLAKQVVAHFQTYLKDNEVEAVVRAHDVMLSDYVFEQMIDHCEETPSTYIPTVTRGFMRLTEQHFGQERDLPLSDCRSAITPRGDTRKYLFNGFAKCALDAQRFHSDDERRFAVLVDQHTPDVKVWLKPGPGVFQITYARGSKYEPDFLVETATAMLICEVKAANELQDPIVRAKAEAARTWIGAANTIAKEQGRKTWRYALIPHDAITANATLDGLINIYG